MREIHGRHAARANLAFHRVPISECRGETRDLIGNAVSHPGSAAFGWTVECMSAEEE
jgi:hypothetical protein